MSNYNPLIKFYLICCWYLCDREQTVKDMNAVVVAAENLLPISAFYIPDNR